MVTILPRSKGFGLDRPLLDELARELAARVRGEVRRDEPMARHTTFRVGGPADLFLTPLDEEDLALMLRLLHQAEAPGICCRPCLHL